MKKKRVTVAVIITTIAAVMTCVFAQSTPPCAATGTSNACGGGTGTFPWPVICSYYPLVIEACYTAQTTGTIQECLSNIATNGSMGCVTATNETRCTYTEYYANCCGNAQHAPMVRTEFVPYYVSDGTTCPGP